MSIRQFFSRDMKMRHLRLLVAIDDAGQLSKVARLLHVSQPALSKALADIERSIGEPLFDRTARGLVANRSGATLIGAARNALAELERASGEIASSSRAPARVLAVGAMPTAALAFLAKAIALLAQREPDIAVRVVDGQTDALLSQLIAGRLQMVAGARTRPAVPDGLEANHLFDDPMVLVVAPGQPLARRGKPTWDDCIAHPWVLPAPGHPTRTAFERALRRASLAPPPRVFDALASDLVLGLVAEAGAVNLMPGRLAGVLAKRGLVRIVGGAHAATLGIQLPVTAFVPSGLQAADGVREMLECLREVAADRPNTRTRAPH